MKLDKRIKSKSDILSCFDIENAKEFVFVDQKGKCFRRSTRIFLYE